MNTTKKEGKRKKIKKKQEQAQPDQKKQEQTTPQQIEETPPSPPLPSIEQCKVYNKLMNAIPEDCITIPFLVDCLLQEVEHKIQPPPEPTEADLIRMREQELEEFLHKTIEHLTASDIPRKRAKTSPPVENVPPTIQLIYELDEIAIRTQRWSLHSLESLEKDLLQKFAMIPRFDRKALTEEERQAEEEQLLERKQLHQHSQFTPQEVDRILLLFEMEDMVNDFLEDQAKNAGKKAEDMETVSFMDRCFIEELAPSVLQQVLAQAMRTNPHVIQKYDPASQAVLLALHMSIPEGKMTKIVNWALPSPTSIVDAPPPKEPEEATQTPQRVSTPQTPQKELKESTKRERRERRETKEEVKQEGPKKEAEVIPEEPKVEVKEPPKPAEIRTLLYPTDGAVIEVVNNSVSKQLTTRVHLGGNIFGMNTTSSQQNSTSTFVGTFVDGSVVWTGVEDGELALVYSSPEGLVVSLSFKDNNVLQLYPRSTKKRPVLSGHDSIETSRIIQINGTVIRNYSDGSKEFIYSNGNTALCNAEGAWMHTSNTGERTGRQPTGFEWKPEPIGVAKMTDPYTMEVLITREDGIRMAHLPDGSFTVTSTDKTVITSAYGSQKRMKSLSVESPDFATVTFTASGCRIKLPNGLEIFSDEETKLVQLPNNQSVKVLRNGTVTYTPSLTSSSVDPAKGSYVFNCNTGTMKTMDNRGNVFNLDEEGALFVAVQSENEEEENNDSTPQTTSHPTRLFVLKEDGSGYEILRGDDVADWIRTKEPESKLQSGTFISKEPLIEDESCLCYTILSPLYKDSDKHLMLWRRLIEFPVITEEKQNAMTLELEQLEDRKLDHQEEADTRSDIEKQQVTEMQQRILQYLSTRQKAERELSTKYQEQLVKHGNALEEQQQEQQQQQQQQQQQEPPKTTILKRVSTPKSERKIPSVDPLDKKPVTDVKYFECDQGLAFLKTFASAPKKEEPRKAPTKKDRKKYPKPEELFADRDREEDEEERAFMKSSPPTSSNGHALPPITVQSPRDVSPRRSTPSPSHNIRPGGSKPSSVLSSRSTVASSHSSRLTLTSPPRKRDSLAVFLLHPTRLDFGTVKLGSTYNLSFSLTNASIDTRRFFIVQPESKLMRVIYTPGPVAPGITSRLELEVAAVEEGSFQDAVKIQTDSEIIELPVSVSISKAPTAVEPPMNPRVRESPRK